MLHSFHFTANPLLRGEHGGSGGPPRPCPPAAGGRAGTGPWSPESREVSSHPLARSAVPEARVILIIIFIVMLVFSGSSSSSKSVWKGEGKVESKGFLMKKPALQRILQKQLARLCPR